jgi:3-hydroxybutyryl-CoA dehydrogenase
MYSQTIQNVAILGAGKIGVEIAVQCAAHELDVTLFDISIDALDRAEQRKGLLLHDLTERGELSGRQAEAAARRFRTTSDPSVAARDAHLVSESIPENLGHKRKVFRQFGELCRPNALMTTNSSFHLPSKLASWSGRPDKFAALHFHTPVWDSNVVDIMSHEGTAPETTDRLFQFARQIGQIPIVLDKENHGYVFNAMLQPVLMSALTLAEQGVSDFQTIDRSWMGIMKTKIGPFGILDQIGLDAARDIISYWSLALPGDQGKKNARFLDNLIKRGFYGVKSQRGFYTYPNPDYAEPNFMHQDREKTSLCAEMFPGTMELAGD